MFEYFIAGQKEDKPHFSYDFGPDFSLLIKIFSYKKTVYIS